MAAGLSLRGFGVRYPGGPWLFEDLSFDLAPGECAGILGGNGCGKSTLIRALAGLVGRFVAGETAGTALWDGRGVSDLDERPATVLQEADRQLLCDGVAEELDFFLRHSRASSHSHHSQEGTVPQGGTTAGSPEVLARSMGISDILDRKVHRLSSGEKQRFVLAAALAFGQASHGQGRLVLLDEPSSILDAQGRGLLREAVLSLKARGSAVVLAGHEFGGLDGVVDRWVRLGEPEPAGTEEAAQGTGSSAPLFMVSDLAADNEAGVRVFSGKSLEVRKGETLGLSGPNGCGKSTFAKAVSGMIAPAGGRAYFVDDHQAPGPCGRAVGLVLQNPYHHFLHRTLRRNLARSVRRAGALPCVTLDEGISALGLGPLLDRDAETLSFGEAQKAAILGEILTGPRLLVVDEPLVGMDGSSTAGLRKVFGAFTRQGAGIIVISHISEFLGRFCGRRHAFA
ncbi:MAG: ATP-binding cassette domain-containing protein [Elusimicrobia bacterium]|nr:ATP-binding cassette domain-containing protein [Elusimicrobiota bacterium]